jgi:hypothetical protein
MAVRVDRIPTPLVGIPIVELVRYGSRADVQSVMVNGKLLIDRGEYTTLDLEELSAQAKLGAERIQQEIEPRRYRPL